MSESRAVYDANTDAMARAKRTADLLAQMEQAAADLQTGKHWSRSRGMVGLVILGVMMVIELSCSFNGPCIAIDHGQALEFTMRAIELFGLVLATYGRINATQPITFTKTKAKD